MNSLGYVFKRARERRKLTIEQVHKVVKVQPQYLRAIEKDDYSIFSSRVHATGFIKIYAEFLGLNSADILALWRRDYSIDVPGKKTLTQAKSKFDVQRYVITPYTIVISIFVVVMLGFFSYLYFQYKNYTGVPLLDIKSPINNQVFDYDIIEIAGSTDPGADVFINNQRIDVSQDGNFTTSIKIKDGLNSLTIAARNKLNRETEQVVSVIYKEPKIIEAQQTSTTEEPSQ